MSNSLIALWDVDCSSSVLQGDCANRSLCVTDTEPDVVCLMVVVRHSSCIAIDSDIAIISWTLLSVPGIDQQDLRSY